jgi:hypothetical protein
MTRRTAAVPFLFFLALGAATTRPAAATTYQRMADRDLTDQAAVIAEVEISGITPVSSRHQVATDYTAEVTGVLKGSVPAGRIVVRVIGGKGPHGISLKILGAPAFAVGERAILFLVPEDDGTYGILHLMLGAFHERDTIDGRKVAVRDLTGAHAISTPGPELYRELAPFSAWVIDRGLGIDRPADYFLPQGTAVVRKGFEKFAFLIDTEGIADRWFRFDQGRSVEWHVFEGGQPGLGLDDTISAFQTALQTWNDDPRTDIRYEYVGTTDANAGFDDYDGVNTILFDDPHHDGLHAVPGSFTCPAGGVIAIGGPWFYSVNLPYHGYRVHESVEADIITNDGTQCLFQSNRTVAEEVFTHELGHTLGLGHTSDPDAIMFASVHNDGRGAALKQDDLDGIAEFYRVSGPPPSKAPTAPAGLTVRNLGGNRVQLKWLDKSKNELGFMVEARIGPTGDFQEVGSAPPNAKSILEDGLVAGQTYAFRLRAYNRKGFSRYSNVVTVKVPS